MVQTQRGSVDLRRGEAIPDDLLPGERQRLEQLDAIGDLPSEPQPLAELDTFTAQAHYLDHVRPVARALELEMQLPSGLAHRLDTRGLRIKGYPARTPRRTRQGALVMGPRDLRTAVETGWERIAYLCHGIGQDYNRTLAAAVPGENIPWERVELVLLPGPYAAERFKPLCPDAERLVVGQPKLDGLMALPAPTRRCAAISFRWPHNRAPESRGALDHYRAGLKVTRERLAKAGVELLGHSHPRIFTEASSVYGAAGIEPVRDFTEVCARANVYACDNSSTLFEFAALDRPVVVMNAPWYRRKANHGGRFWDWADVGEQVEGPGDLAAAIVRALGDPLGGAQRRREVVAEVLPLADGGATRRAAGALSERFPVPSGAAVAA